jgi:hypothetical protein
VSAHPTRLVLVNSITSVCAEAADTRSIICSHRLATQLHERYPQSGMTVRDIERELIRQAIVARVVVTIGQMPDERAILLGTPNLKSARSRSPIDQRTEPQPGFCSRGIVYRALA